MVFEPTSLAKTGRGRAWLQNFDEDERDSARLLLDNISIVSDSQFRSNLRVLLRRSCGASSPTPTAAYAITNIRKQFRPHYFGCQSAHEENPPATECPPQGLVGSELVVENILNKVAKSYGLYTSASVPDLKTHQVRRILLVTDNIVTGEEASRFAEYVYSNPSIRSWHSYRRIRIEIVAHSISELALMNLGNVYPIHYEQIGRTFETTQWSREQLDAVRALCKKYSAIKGEALGRGAAESLLIFGHTFGNGLPAILRQRAGREGARWLPLLPSDRDFGLDSVDAAGSQGYIAPESLIPKLAILAGTVQHRIPRLQVVIARTGLRYAAHYEMPLVALLAAIDAGHRAPFEIMKAASMSMSRFREIARLADSLGLVEGYAKVLGTLDVGRVLPTVAQRKRAERFGLRLSPGGRRFLRRQGRRTRSIDRVLRSNAAPLERPNSAHIGKTSAIDEFRGQDPPSNYYPQSLR